MQNYFALDRAVDKLSNIVCHMINSEVLDIKSEMPYKAQYVLEELIKKLQERV